MRVGQIGRDRRRAVYHREHEDDEPDRSRARRTDRRSNRRGWSAGRDRHSAVPHRVTWRGSAFGCRCPRSGRSPVTRVDSMPARSPLTLRDAADVPVVEPAPGETPLWPMVELAALFPLDTDCQRAANRLIAELGAEFDTPNSTCSSSRTRTGRKPGAILRSIIVSAAGCGSCRAMRLQRRATASCCASIPDSRLAPVGTRRRRCVSNGSRWPIGCGCVRRRLRRGLRHPRYRGAAARRRRTSSRSTTIHRRASRRSDNATYNGIAAQRLERGRAGRSSRARLTISCLANILAGPLVTLAPRVDRIDEAGRDAGDVGNAGASDSTR